MIQQRQDVHFYIITKRIGRFEVGLPSDWDEGYPNVTVAVTCENQQRADERIPLLLSAPIRHKEVHKLRQQRVVAGYQRTEADDMHVVFHRHVGGFFRRHEQWADVHVEAEVGESGGDDLGAPVVTVLTNLGDQHTRTASVFLLEFVAHVLHFFQIGVLRVL